MTHPTHGLDPNALEAALREASERFGTIKYVAHNLIREDGMKTIWELARLGQSSIAALSQNSGTSNTSGEAVGQKVKPLEWEHFPDGFPAFWSARTPLGPLSYYSIEAATKEADALGEPIEPIDIWIVSHGPGHTPIRACYSLDEAKAAAQADYEQRILAALEPRASDRARTIEECARIAHKAHLTYAQLRDTHRRDTLDWAEADASTKAAAAIWHAIGDLLPRDPNDPTEAAIRKLSEVSHEH